MKLGVLASHAGTTLQCVLDAIADKRIDADVVLIISNNSQSGAMQRGAENQIETLHVSAVTHPDEEERDGAICNALTQRGVDLVLLAGYMKPLGTRTLTTYAGRILNTHPSLLPKYGGQGFFGVRVHEAVLAAGDSETGATVHIVTTDYDEGPIVGQVTVPVRKDDSVDSLQERVKVAERSLLVEVLREWSQQRESDQTEDQGPSIANVTPGV